MISNLMHMPVEGDGNISEPTHDRTNHTSAKEKRVTIVVGVKSRTENKKTESE